MTSSLFEPNTAFLERFHNLAELCRVVDRRTVVTRRLDDISEIGAVGFLKLDVQGAELKVLTGGVVSLKRTLVVHTEVEFVEIYAGQPLFADIDQFLRGHGFVFHRFAGLEGRTMRPLFHVGDPDHAMSQILWGDAVYVRGVGNPETLGAEELLAQAIILHDVYQSFDLALFCLSHYDARTGSALATSYRTMLTTAASHVGVFLH